MQIKVRVDTSRLEALLKDATKRTVYATVNALNKTALEIQQGIRAHAMQVFHVRDKPFIMRQVAKIEKVGFASPKAGRFYAEIHVGHVQTGKSELLLSEYEAGVVRAPEVGANLAIPTEGGPARRTKQSKIPKRFYFESLNFHREKGRIIGGEGRSLYIVPGVGVFQRSARGSRAVYLFSRTVHIRPSLDFVYTARKIAARRFAANVRDAVAAELAQAQARGQIVGSK